MFLEFDFNCFLICRIFFVQCGLTSSIWRAGFQADGPRLGQSDNNDQKTNIDESDNAKTRPTKPQAKPTSPKGPTKANQTQPNKHQTTTAESHSSACTRSAPCRGAFVMDAKLSLLRALAESWLVRLPPPL